MIFIKIGGSLITHKDQPFTLNQESLSLIASEVKRAHQQNPNLILGHGAGSFAHTPAKKYQTHRGLVDEKSKQGIVEVTAAAAKLHQLVMEALFEADVPAISFPPHAMMSGKDHQLGKIFVESLEKSLDLGLLPVVYGDQILDQVAGCTIFSTEMVLTHLAFALKKEGYEIEQMIQCGLTNGVYDQAGETIPLITPTNFGDYKTAITGSDGVDVTGGMLHKVEASLHLAEQGIKSLIIDGIEHGTLSKAVKGEKVIGTKVGFSHGS